MMIFISSPASFSINWASTARDAADAVRQARPDGGASACLRDGGCGAFTSLMQSVEEKCVDTCTVPSDET